jgi:DNA-binding NtrC family response regulator
MDSKILVVDDDPDYLDILVHRLKQAGFGNLLTEESPIQAAALFEKNSFFDIALIDMNMPELDGMALLEIIKTRSPLTECIMVTAVNDARTAVECLRKGAYDYLVKPVRQEDLVFALNRTLERKRLLDILDIEKSDHLPRLIDPKPFEPIVTRSRSVMRVLKAAELHAKSNVPVLITGDSGTGKELLARAIHTASRRHRYPFTAVNMASITSSLFDAEFFGHTKGAFTGAEKGRVGYIEHTHRGTLFLDEIGDLPMDLQGKLLRVFQDGEYMKLGTSSRQRANVRFIAATNVKLEKKMSQGAFRKDLYYRIRGSWLHLPPLTDRPHDIPVLANHFLKAYCENPEACHITEEAMCCLMAYGFPGNIRELKSIIQSAINLAQGRPIQAEFFPKEIRKTPAANACLKPSNNMAPLTLAEVEKAHILKIYQHTQQNKSQTARRLGIGLNTLRRKLKSYDIN